MVDKCVICDKLLANTITVIVKEKALQTLINASKQRNDGKLLFFQNQVQLKLHRKCRIAYTNNRCIEAAIKKKNQVPHSNEVFAFENQCIFCAKDASDAFLQEQTKYSKEKRIAVGHLQRPETLNTITKSCIKHDDDWSEEVLLRVKKNDTLKNGKYHYNCYKNFCHPHRVTGMKRGRPSMPKNSTAMDYVFRYLDDINHDDCQFSVAEIRQALHEIELPSDQLIKYHLKQKYGDEIVITSGNPSVICFLKNSLRVIQDSWYEARDKNEHSEKLRIVETAAKIVLNEIISRPYETDMYPPPNCFLDTVTEDCPESLLLFLKTIILNRKTNKDLLERKCVAIAHSIISAVRPRSFKSPLLLGLGAVIHHKYASRFLIDLFNSLGFCATYAETLKFETSAIGSYAPKEVISDFTQFVFDNADINVNTLDGKNTFHVMGGIQCINPPQTKSLSHKIPRLNYVPKTFLKRFDQVTMKTYQKPAKSGLDEVTYKAHFSEENLLDLSKPHFIMWLYEKSLGISGVPGWHTFMAKVHKEVVTEEQVTEIRPLPFINAPASNYDTILTALHFAAELCNQSNTECCLVTFDQPLFQKAQEIVKSSEDPIIKNIILRLGGFHLLMSFMGAVGYIMNGSGLKEMWSCVYAAGSLDKMISGHHYERSVRAHSLSSIALFDKILKNTDLTPAEKDNLIFQVIDNDALLESSDLTISAFQKINKTLLNLEEKGPTAQLWVSYYKMTLIIQNYIKAERIGDWFLHLEMIKLMLPYFHAAGHFNYAKSASLYIQDMENLQEKMPPNIFQKFVTEKLFTIRRTKKSYSGTWSDMTIEQSLMRSMKTAGGLTQGRGYTDNVLGKWILGLPILHTITEEIEEFCNTTNRQHIHKDGTKSRMEQDDKDIECFKNYFSENNPFPDTSDIISISTGVVGNTNINPHKAREIGMNMMRLKDGTSYGNMKYSRKETVKSLATVNSAVTVDDTIIAIEPDIIFKRISFLKKTQEELKEYLKYELSPYPVALFDKTGMRKTKKSALYDMFKPVPSEKICEGDKAHIIDGGFLLHKVVWPTGLTTHAICKKYIDYIKNHYTNPTVVFDGYDNEMNVKNQERKRRINI